MSIRLLIVDDQPLIRAGFRTILDSVADIDVVGEATNGRHALELTRRERPDVVLMDIRMPEMDGIAATRAIATDPDLDGVRVLVLTTFEQDDHVVDAVDAGASGFVGKGIDPDALIDAVRVIASGEGLLSPLATKATIAELTRRRRRPASDVGDVLGPLTDREREVMALAATGLTNHDIANELFLSPLTVKTHLNRAMSKLGARDRSQLVVIAYRSGLVDPDPPSDSDRRG